MSGVDVIDPLVYESDACFRLVLDIGCGSGQSMKRLLDLDKVFRVVGVAVSVRSISNTESLLKGFKPSTRY